jgi:hypothetical protein
VIPTADPNCVIEEQREGYVRYRALSSGRRWEVHGVCDQRGDCLIGANVWTPDGTVEIRDHAHIQEIKERYGMSRLGPDLDVPMNPSAEGCCPMTFVELRDGD